jgi:hypothetical protein
LDYDEPLSKIDKYPELGRKKGSSFDQPDTVTPEPLDSAPTSAEGTAGAKKKKVAFDENVEESAEQGITRSARNLVARLKKPDEFLKLYLKHYHMSTRQFRLRTSELHLPEAIYKNFDDIVNKCETCQKHKPAPPRSRISGLRATNFGDLMFVDHGTIKVKTLNRSRCCRHVCTGICCK